MDFTIEGYIKMMRSNPVRNTGTNLDSIGFYRKALNKIPEISPEEMLELAYRTTEGDTDAREALIESNLPMAFKIAKEKQGFGMPLADLIEEANVELIKCVDTYDPNRGTTFATHAWRRIQFAVQKALMNHDRTLQLPPNILRQINAYRKAKREVTLEEEHTQQDEELAIANKLHMSTEKVEAIKTYMEAMEISSLDAPITSGSSDSEGEETSLGEILEDMSTRDIGSELDLNRRYKLLNIWMKRLAPIERKVIEMKMAIGAYEDSEPMNFEVIGFKLGVSPQRVGTAWKQGVRTLHAFAKAHKRDTR